jgi:hypothetical protein
MTPAERRVIELFAAGDNALRGHAIDIFRDDLKYRGRLSSDIHQNFMSEVDNPSPDLVLRAQYRKLVRGIDKPKVDE